MNAKQTYLREYPQLLASEIAVLKQQLTCEELFKLWKKRHEKYLQKVRETFEKNKARYKRQQDAQIKTIFNIGEQVLLHNDHKKNKLDTEWIGPVKIIQANPPNYTIKFPDS